MYPAPLAGGLKQHGYHLGQKIGEGNYSTVRLATHIGRDGKKKVWACKIVNLAKCSEEIREKFFPRELQIMSGLEHPHLLSVHRVLRCNERIFIFLPYARRGDLFQYLNKYGPLKEAQAKEWFTQLLQAVHYLHSNGIVHRDVKCENLLITGDGKLLLGDFGFAKQCWCASGARRHWSETFCGSAAYAAPEVITGQRYDPVVADLWSMGIVLFMMLNGVLPFGETNMKRLLKLQTERRYCFEPLLPRAPSAAAKSTIDQLLHPDPEQRIRMGALMQLSWVAGSPRVQTK
ncbi:testis-specific serine/threonine-protein kinase 1-like [Anopheles bellator]|uniref:testis-specific serine/threonine-protein kinase 1-like n=1 Tax=Anopheles bellator TaxID=139047 RepID=UPI002648A21F|nr:testis-specific serine/threonine-protein kinase 1-like [Anopheles bellator]